MDTKGNTPKSFCSVMQQSTSIWIYNEPQTFLMICPMLFCVLASSLTEISATGIHYFTV